MSSKPKTFRVRRVPADISIQSLAQFLQVSVPDLGGAENIHVGSLAPSPDDWTSPRSQAATLEFNEIPKPLQDPSRTTWEFTAIGSRLPLIFDTHFLGFTPLNSVDDRHHSYDLIAVSGLASHPFGSWRQRKPPGQRQFMWLRDQLPYDCRTIRCMTYGYDTKLVGSNSFQSLDDLACSFIHHLRSIGRAEYSARPLILLGHSLGGILVKRALSLLAASGETYKFMLSKTKLFMAFGVPNRGMRIDHLLAVVGSMPNRDLIETIEEKSSSVLSWLSLVDEQFSGIAEHFNIRVVSVYETETTPLTEIQSTGEAQRSGTWEILVQPGSAIQCRSKKVQDIFPINRNHSDMVKFERDDPCYFVVRNFVRETVGNDDANESGLMLGPLSQGSTPFLQTLGQHGKEPAEPDERAHVESKPMHDLLSSTLDDVVDTTVLLKSLDFEEINFRFEAIERAHESSFGWIFEKPELEFIPWILKGTGVYWIRGKPGSGKSTLMKYLHDNEQLNDAIEHRVTRGRRVCMWFFFNERGTYLQKSLDGLLRGMLVKLISQEPAIAELILETYRSKPRQIRDHWSFNDLQEVFTTVLTQENHDLELTIFLDALDEYYGIPEVISQFILDTMSTSRNTPGRTKVRFCFSSREWDIFVKTFSSEPGFVLHEHTYGDVKQYTISRLSRLTSQHPSTAHDRPASPRQLPPVEVARLIASRAEGVFLWVKLAIDEIALSPEISSQDELEMLVNRLPADLEEFYLRTISRIPKHSRYRAFTLLEIVSRSSDLLTPWDLFYASACASGSTFQECEDHRRDAESRLQRASIEDEDISRDLLNLCGGLLECVIVVTSENESRPVVQFIHRTLRDFVASPQFPQAILGDAYRLQLDNGYTFLLKYRCVLTVRTKSVNPNVELLELAYRDESSTGRPATTFIDSLPALFFAHRVVPHKNHHNCTSPFLFGVLGNLHLYVQECLGDLEAHRAERPLNKIAWLLICPDHFDWTTDFSKMVQLLLRHGFGVSDELWGLTPFETIHNPYHYPFVFGTQMVNFARVLIQDGQQDPNALLRLEIGGATRERRSALHVASGCVAQMLLENGADVNVRDSEGNTPLDVLVLESIGDLPHDPVSEFFKIGMLLLSHGGRLSRRGKKHLPAFLKIMRKAGYQFPDTLLRQAAIDEETKAIGVRSKIRDFISRHLD